MITVLPMKTNYYFPRPKQRKKEENKMKVKENPCAKCGYHYKTEEDEYPCCHFEGPDGWAPCEQEDYETEDTDE